MFRNTERAANEKAVNDENAVNLPAKSVISGILGPRRNVLGDVSNATNPSVVHKTTLLPKRNLRSSTVQASLAVKNKIASVVSSSDTSSVPVSGRPSVKFSGIENKENVAPSRKEHHPPIRPSAAGLDVEHVDVDAEVLDDPSMVAEYAPEIFAYMMELEKKSVPGDTFMILQKEITVHMRSVLIDWLIEVQWKSKLKPETLYLTVNIVDRFLARRAVSLVKLQLVGLAASLLASKYEEILSPSVGNFIYFSDNAYTEQELLKAERYMLHVLDFNMAFPSPLTFLRRVSQADNYDIRHRFLAKYLMEVTLLDPRFANVPPSMLGAVGLYLARVMLGSPEWSSTLVHYSGGYTESDLKPWATMILEFLMGDAHKYPMVYKKYYAKNHMKASFYVQEYLRKHYNAKPRSLTTSYSQEQQ